MSSKPTRIVGKAAKERISGGKPGPLRAMVAAAVIGVGAAVLTYRLLRSGG
jgi:hypothetical protein